MSRGVAVITGGTRGIGLALCRSAHKQGFDVLTCSQSGAPEDFGFPHVVCDLTDPADIERLVVEAASRGPIRLLINNAGGIFASSGLDGETHDAVSRTFQLNVAAPIAMARHLTPYLADAGGGLIVNVTSLYGTTGSQYVLSYSASKAALLNATKSLAMGLAPQGIRVNAISPGNIDTKMTRSAGQHFVDDVTARTPLQRLGDPTEVGDVLSFLVGAAFVTGEEIVIDGGIGLVGG